MCILSKDKEESIEYDNDTEGKGFVVLDLVLRETKAKDDLIDFEDNVQLIAECISRAVFPWNLGLLASHKLG